MASLLVMLCVRDFFSFLLNFIGKRDERVSVFPFPIRVREIRLIIRVEFHRSGTHTDTASELS